MTPVTRACFQGPKHRPDQRSEGILRADTVRAGGTSDVVAAVCALLSLAAAVMAGEPDESPAKPWMVSEAKLPEGFPPPGPIGEVIVKTYPAHRLARVTAKGGADGMFMKLFGHIKRNNISMTAPVEMSWGDAAAGGGAPRDEPTAMAFLYGSPTLGELGADAEDPRVVVEDIPQIKVASIGLRGSYGEKTFNRGYRRLEAWLAEHPEWEVAGGPRTLGYNSPFIPGFAKFSEVQLPIRPAKQPAEP